MRMLHCPNCNARRGFKRHIGIGSLLLVLFTLGLAAPALLLMPARCITCGSPPHRTGSLVWFAVAASAVLLAVAWLFLGRETPEQQAAREESAERRRDFVENRGKLVAEARRLKINFDEMLTGNDELRKWIRAERIRRGEPEDFDAETRATPSR